MKVILSVLFALLITSSALATPPGSPTAPQPVEVNDTAEAAALAVSGAFALLNVATVAAHSPSYWFGGIGIGAGVTALALSAQDNASFQAGLVVTGLSAVASGLASVRYRYVLNRRNQEVRFEPTWHGGSPGLALVVDF